MGNEVLAAQSADCAQSVQAGTEYVDAADLSIGERANTIHAMTLSGFNIAT